MPPVHEPAPGSESGNEVLREVVVVRDDRPDMAIGETDHEVLVGNHVTIRADSGMYVLLAHLQADSISMAGGDRVRRSQPVARCGNSGNTSGPHLHIQAQNRAGFSNDDPELETFPFHFSGATRVRDGVETSSPSPVRRNDWVRPERLE